MESAHTGDAAGTAADAEHNFDELKNHWGWGGFTTQDLKRCRCMARTTALIDNGWSLFIRLADPDQHAEAIISRSPMLYAIGKQSVMPAESV